MVFDPDPSAIFERMKTLCGEQGLVGVAPLDNQIGLEHLPPGKTLLQRIVRADIELMDRLEAAVFCLDGFRRGPEMDAGTAFEIGYMKALGKPIAGWTRDPRTYRVKVADFIRTAFGEELVTTTAGLVGGTSGLLRDPDGILCTLRGLRPECHGSRRDRVGRGRHCYRSDSETAFRGAIASVARQLRRPGET